MLPGDGRAITRERANPNLDSADLDHEGFQLVSGIGQWVAPLVKSSVPDVPFPGCRKVGPAYGLIPDEEANQMLPGRLAGVPGHARLQEVVRNHISKPLNQVVAQIVRGPVGWVAE